MEQNGNTKELLFAGIKPNIKGFTYIADAIEMHRLVLY